MSKFVVRKTFSLSFVADEWKEAYLIFNAFSVQDIKERLSKLSTVNQEDNSQVTKGLDLMVTILEDKFVEGKAPTEGGLVDVKKEDIKDMPVEVIAKAVSFLSQGLSKQDQTLCVMSFALKVQ